MGFYRPSAEKIERRKAKQAESHKKHLESYENRLRETFARHGWGEPSEKNFPILRSQVVIVEEYIQKAIDEDDLVAMIKSRHNEIKKAYEKPREKPEPWEINAERMWNGGIKK